MPNNIIRFAILPVIIVIAFIWQRWMNRHFDYQCENCRAVFPLPIWQGVFAPHAMGRKLVRCPNCGQMSWVSPVNK